MTLSSGMAVALVALLSACGACAPPPPASPTVVLPDAPHGPRRSVGRYLVDDNTALDPQTGLVWQRHATADRVPFDAARSACVAMRAGGQADWRLPEKRELWTLWSDAALGLDPDAFAPLQDGAYWSGTRLEGATPAAWVVALTYKGEDFGMRLDSGYAVRCVRGTPKWPSPPPGEVWLDDDEAGRVSRTPLNLRDMPQSYGGDVTIERGKTPDQVVAVVTGLPTGSAPAGTEVKLTFPEYPGRLYMARLDAAGRASMSDPERMLHAGQRGRASVDAPPRRGLCVPGDYLVTAPKPAIWRFAGRSPDGRPRLLLVPVELQADLTTREWACIASGVPAGGELAEPRSMPARAAATPAGSR
jgi:hypothetical protein